MLWTLDKKNFGFTLTEVLISILIISIAGLIFFTAMERMEKNFSIVSKYFSEDSPLDTETYVYQSLTAISDIISNTYVGSSLPDISTFNSTNVEFSYGEITPKYVDGVKIIEIIPINVRYIDKSGKTREIEEYVVVRGNY